MPDAQPLQRRRSPLLKFRRVSHFACHKLRPVIRASLFALLLVAPIATAPAQPKQVQMQGAEFVGAAGCSSSSCHGGAGEKRSQFITWSRQDVHTRGYATLTNARSERMAAGLGLQQQPDGPNAAPTSTRCTVCHSPFHSVPQAQRAPTAEPTESISCESCHGAAGGWLRGHTRPDWTYAMRVGAGMRDLESLYVRANTCVACHQNLDPAIVAAGHPELVFELDGQSAREPKHWTDPEGSGPRAWLTGQAVALRELSWRLAMNPTGDPNSLAQWNALVWLLSHVTAADTSMIVISPDEQPFADTQKQADALARRAAQANLGSDFAARVLQRLLSLDREFTLTTSTPREVLFRRAQRLVLAIERLSIATLPPAQRDQPQTGLDSLRDDLRSPAAFDPVRFAQMLADFRTSLMRAEP